MNGESSNLDILRSLAVLFVVISHLPISASMIGTHHYNVQALGLFGVSIFFVHTCLVLMRSLERQSAEFGERHLALIFFIRRAFRIYPLSIAVVLLLCAVARPSLGIIASNLLLIQNLMGHPSIPGALWSLPFEVQMYILLPALYILVNRSTQKATGYLWALWLGSVALVIIAWRAGLNYHLIKFIPCFLPGVLAFTMRKSPCQRSPVVLFLYVGIMAALFPWAVAHGMKENILAWPVCLGLGLLIPGCREIEPALIQKTGKLIARYSYGIYLVHGPCIDFSFGHARAPLIEWAVFIFSTTVLSYLAYHEIEKPGIELGRRIASGESLWPKPLKV